MDTNTPDLGYHYPVLTDFDLDGMEDGWEWKHFGTMSRDGTGDYDGDTVTDAVEFAGQTEPNDISALLQFTNLWVATTNPAGVVEVLGGVPAQMAVLVNDTNFADAIWSGYNSNFTAALGPTDGVYAVRVGLRGRAVDSQPTWLSQTLTLDRVPPLLVFTNPAALTGSVVFIQVQGYVPEPVENIRYSVSNAAGLVTNQQAFVSDQFYDTNGFAFTTNFFHAYDLLLTNGPNEVEFRVEDLAGNVAVTNLCFTLEADSTPPILGLSWPQDGARLCGDNFIIAGSLDDPSAKIEALVTDANGNTNCLAGVVERFGRFWVEAVPLADGTNWLTLTGVDVWGNSNATNLHVIRSGLGLTVASVPTNELHQATVTISGSLTNAGYTVWVNGVQAALTNGDWQADEVPVTAGSTATFAITAYPPGQNPSPDPNNPASNPPAPDASHQMVPVDKPMRVWVEQDFQTWTETISTWENVGGQMHWGRTEWRYSHVWNDGCGSEGSWYDRQTSDSGGSLCRSKTCWPASSWPQLVGGTVQGSDDCPVTNTCPPPEIALEHCSVTVDQSLGGQDWGWVKGYMRIADTKVKLYTGGKAIPGRPCIFVLQGGAAEILFKEAKPPYRTPWLSPQDQRQIPPEEVILGAAGPLGSDGFTYKRFGVGETLDITPRVKGKPFYKFEADAGKHRLVHETECRALTNPDRNRTKIGVGEEVRFYFDPPLGMHDPEQHEWTTTAGSVEMIGPYEWGLHGSWAWFTAPSNATENVIVKVEVRNAVIETPFTVIAPEGVDAGRTRIDQTFHYPSALGIVCAGMHVTVYIAPTDVSFYRVNIVEPTVPGTGISGYFTHFPTNNFWHRGGVRGTVECENLSSGDTCSFNRDGFSTDFAWPYDGVHPEAGEFHFVLNPAKWKIGDGDAHDMNWSDQHHILQSNGWFKIIKFGLEVKRNILDDTVVPDIQP